PPRMVRRQNRHARVPWNPRREPVRYALRHPGQFREGDSLHRLRPLNLQGNVVGELPGRFLEALVESGHVRGEYTKDAWGKLGTGPLERGEKEQVQSRAFQYPGLRLLWATATMLTSSPSSRQTMKN